MKFLKSLQVFLVAILIIGLATPISTGAAVVSSGDLMQINKTVSNNTVVKGETTDVTMTVKGTPKDSTFVKPNDVVLIIDKSGSMSADNRMEAAKEAAKEFIDLMDLTKHELGIVDFQSSANSFALTTDKNAAKAYVDTIQLGGGTNTSAAIAAATSMLSTKRPNVQPTIVIMTDGAADSAPAARAAAQAAKDAGITFYSIALLGPNENPDASAPNQLLKEMASSFDHHHFVLGSVGLSDVYKQIVEEIGLASAYNVTITDTISSEFELVPGSYDHHIPKPTVTGNTIKWFISELKTNELSFTYQVRAKADATAGKYPVAQTATTFEMGDSSIYSLNTTNPIVEIKNHAPIITSITEDKGLTAGGETVTIAGQYFLPGAKVYFGSTLATVISVTDNKIIVTTPVGKQGTVDVKVENTDRQSAIGKYNYYAVPTITSITPPEGMLIGGNTVTVTGTNFMPGITVYIDDVAAKTTFFTANKLTAVVPAATESGIVSVKIVNPDATTAELADAYTYLAPPPAPLLELHSLTATSGLIAGGESITLNGIHFDTKVKVYFGDNEATSVTYITTERVRVRVPAAVSPGFVSVKAENPDGSISVLADAYEYLTPPPLPAPKITSIVVTSILLNESKNTLIYGENFAPTSRVFFGDQQATMTFLSPTNIRVKIPASAVPGTVDVKVINIDDQEAVAANAFSYTELTPEPAPVITSLSSLAGPISGNETVIITGDHFKSGAKVYFGNVLGIISAISANEITVRTPKSLVTGFVSVTIVNPDLQEVTLQDAYKYEGLKPTITNIPVNSGALLGGYNVLVYGTNFSKDMTITVGGQSTTYTLLSPTQVRVRIPAGVALGVVDLIIDLHGETATAPFTYK